MNYQPAENLILSLISRKILRLAAGVICRLRWSMGPRFWSASAAAMLAIGLSTVIARAQVSGTGNIEGRVLNVGTGNYLNNAQVEIVGTGIKTFTNPYGEYRIGNIPAGPQTVRVVYTGLPDQTQSVEVPNGRTIGADFNYDPAKSATVVMSALVVAAGKETDARAIAINEQRYAPNLKTVVSADQFGNQSEGNVGEFAKYLPGINVEYNAADAYRISVRGLPSFATVVTVDGNRMASSSALSPSRSFELEQNSMNNVSRVEVTKVPTPDMAADAVGGTVNLVSKSAFERSRPEFSYRLLANFNSYNTTLAKTPGPAREPSRKIRPGGDFSWIYPLSKNFGFTLSGLSSRQANREARTAMTWSPTSVAATGGSTVENPALLRWTHQDGTKFNDRDSFSITADWRFLPRDVVKVGFQYSRYNGIWGDQNVNYNVGAISAGNFGPTFTQGNSGAGSITKQNNSNTKMGFTQYPSIAWRHDGTVWKFDGGAYMSRSQTAYRNEDQGFFTSATLTLSNVTIRYNDIDYLSPKGFTVTTAAGAPVNDRALSSYSLTSVRGEDRQTMDYKNGAHLNGSRIFDFGVPFTIKAGADVLQQIRDTRIFSNPWTPTVPINGAQFVSPGLSAKKRPFGIPPTEWMDMYAIYDYQRAHPEQFATVLTGTSGRIFNQANDSTYLQETIAAYYLRGDTRLWKNRLWIVGGVRFEKTMDRGEGLLRDPNAIFQKDAAGKPTTVLVTADPIEQANLMFKNRGAHGSKSYDGFYPSLNLTADLSDQLVARAGFARTISRPDYSNIIPGYTITPPSGSDVFGAITVRNTALRPWNSNNYDVSLEYYTRGAGVVSAGVFYKDISDFHGSQTVPNAPADLIASLGLDPSYTGYSVTTRLNSGNARVSGYEINLSQGLTFLQGWASRFNLFANTTQLRVEGEANANFSGFATKVVNWGIGYQMPSKFSLAVKWNYRGLQRGGATTGAGFPPGLYQYTAPRLTTDLNAEYTIKPWLKLFVVGRNVLNQPLDQQRYILGTPDYAKMTNFENYGAQWTIGVSGKF